MTQELDEDVKVFEPSAGSSDGATRQLWRRYRQAAYRLGYKEREGKNHPASKAKANKADDEVVASIEPPKGMTFDDFGVTWDLHPEHPSIPVLRSRSVADQFQDALDAEE